MVSSVTAGAARAPPIRSKSRSSSSKEFFGRPRALASPMSVQSFCPTFSASKDAISAARAARRFAWVDSADAVGIDYHMSTKSLEPVEQELKVP